MSGGANQAFTSNPRGFLGANLILTEMQDSGTATIWRGSGRYTANLQVHPDHRAALPDRTPVQVYRLSLATGSAFRLFGKSHRFRIHYLAYQPNTEQHLTLDDTADYFFTDTLNGCCFVTGRGANPTVSHINYTVGRVAGTAIDDLAIANEIVSLYGTSPRKVLAKGTYKNNVGAYVTVVGVRNTGNNHWRFYWQRYEWQAPPQGVHPSTTGKFFEFQDARVRL